MWLLINETTVHLPSQSVSHTKFQVHSMQSLQIIVILANIPVLAFYPHYIYPMIPTISPHLPDYQKHRTFSPQFIAIDCHVPTTNHGKTMEKMASTVRRSPRRPAQTAKPSCSANSRTSSKTAETSSVPGEAAS